MPLYTLFDISCWGREYGDSWLESYKSMALGVFSDHLWFLLMLYWVSLVFILMIPLLRKDLIIVMGLITLGLAVVIELFCTFEYYKSDIHIPALLLYRHMLIQIQGQD